MPRDRRPHRQDQAAHQRRNRSEHETDRRDTLGGEEGRVEIAVVIDGSERRAEFGERDATYSVAVSADLTEVDFNRAKAFEDPLVYAARIIKGKDGWYLIGFVNEVDGQFVGELCDPVPVSATVEAGLVRR
jgi:hypothetical protein